MKKYKFIIGSLLLFIVTACQNNKKSRDHERFDKQPIETVLKESDRETDIESGIMNESVYSQHIPSIEDTLKYQLGGELPGLKLTPQDSINVIKSTSFSYEDGTIYREYHYVIHSTDTYLHDQFSSESLDKTFKGFFHEYTYNYWHSKLDSIPQDPGLIIPEKYQDYWIYLIYIPEFDDYFLESYMGTLGTFKLGDTLKEELMMDGVYPDKITSFAENNKGFTFIINNSKEYNFEIIDSQRELYLEESNQGKYYCTPARNYNKYKIRGSVNNTGDLI